MSEKVKKSDAKRTIENSKAVPMDVESKELVGENSKPKKIPKLGEEKQIKKVSKAKQEEYLELFGKYKDQVMRGCGKKNCENPNCASNPDFKPLKLDVAVLQALKMMKNKEPLCERLQTTTGSVKSSLASIPTTPSTPSSPPTPATPKVSSGEAPSSSFSSLTLSTFSSPLPLRLVDVQHLIRVATGGSTTEKDSTEKDKKEKDKKDGKDFRLAIRAIGGTFGDAKALNNSFFTMGSDDAKTKVTDTDPAIDMKELQAAYELLGTYPELTSALESGCRRLINALNIEALQTKEAVPQQLRVYAILLQNPCWGDQSNADTLKLLFKAVAALKQSNRQILTNWFSTYSKDYLERLVNIVQQYITLRWMLGKHITDISMAVSVLGMVYAANELVAARSNEDNTPLRYELFYNEAVNEDLNLREDYRRWRAPPSTGSFFSFAAHPFILDPAAKARLLQIDAIQQMQYQFEEAVVQSLFERTSPYLVLAVNRENLVAQTLLQLQSRNSNELKKPLKIKFIGESGVDEGGLQKEFFQLIIKQIFEIQYGMFTYSDETRTFWFRSDSLESANEFELIGILLGLAIYNSIILDIQFPDIIYKKLMGHKPTLRDLKAQNPELARGLQQLLEFKGDVKETFLRTFTVSYETILGEKTVELKKDGAKISLTNENRKEYVDLYVEWELTKSIEKQFKAFASGFDLVTGGEPLKLFRWEELELLICGSPTLDFHALEEVTMYEEPYSADHRVIKDFWQVVHDMKLEDKKKLLFFATGSDRVPIKGLGNLSFAVSRSGPDSDKLPTSHTCFNHLLLPEYSTKAKLERLLQLAIRHSKGFGLL